MIVLGLTGSIGMGKTTTAGLFAAAGVPVYSADAAVHAPIGARFPGTVSGGAVDRDALARRVLGDPAALEALEAIVHPLVREAETAFLQAARETGASLAVLDIPLLFETGGEARVDKVLVVSAPPGVQRARVLARPGMTEEKLAVLLARQMPDAEKRRRADVVIDTSRGLDAARAAVNAVIESLRAE